LFTSGGAEQFSRHLLKEDFMKNALLLLILLAFGANCTTSKAPATAAGDATDWFFHYDKAVAYEAQKKHGKAYKSLNKAAELAIESLNEKKMLERLLADQNGTLQYLAAGPQNHNWGHIRKALETRDLKWLKEDVYQDPFDDHSGHKH